MQFIQDSKEKLQTAWAKTAAMAREKERVEREKREAYIRVQDADLPTETLAYIFKG